MGNDMSFRPHAQPVRSLVRKIFGIRFFGTRYADEWIDQSDCCDGGVDLEQHHPAEAYEEFPGVSMSGAASLGKPACNCGH
jgi:hypothetical protein